MCYQIQPSVFFIVWTFISCFARDLREIKQNNKFNTDQLICYILNIQNCFIKSSQVVSSKFGLSFHFLIGIFDSWSRITNLTLTNCFVIHWTFTKCIIKSSQVISSKFGLSFHVLKGVFERWSKKPNLTLTTDLLHIEHLKNVLSNQSKWFLHTMDFHFMFWLGY